MLGLRPVRQILDKLDAATSSVTVKLPEFLLIFAMKTMWVCLRRPIVVFVICARGSLSRVQSCPLEPRWLSSSFLLAGHSPGFRVVRFKLEIVRKIGMKRCCFFACWPFFQQCFGGKGPEPKCSKVPWLDHFLFVISPPLLYRMP